MSQSYNKIWVHSIWSTKDRKPMIRPEIEQRIYHYISEQLHELGCPMRIINGMPDHVHCLFLLDPQKSIASVMKQIKGSTSHFVNQNDLINQKFSWQRGYAAFSVSESTLERVHYYIKGQKTHHQVKSYREEYEGFLELYGFQYKS